MVDAVHISRLGDLEPILGLATALNLAYLNIPKFGYIVSIRALIKERLGSLDKSAIESCENTPWFKQLSAISSVKTLEEVRDPETKFKPWVDCPGIWGFLFNVFFYWRTGRIGAIGATAYCLSLLILGTAQSVGVAKWSVGPFVATEILDDLILASLAALWPTLVVCVGWYVRRSAAKFVRYQTESLKTEAVREAAAEIDSVAASIADPQPSGPARQGSMSKAREKRQPPA